MYVALSRAKNFLTLIIPDNNPNPLFKLGWLTGLAVKDTAD
jgi:hypothetical protein